MVNYQTERANEWTKEKKNILLYKWDWGNEHLRVMRWYERTALGKCGRAFTSSMLPYSRDSMSLHTLLQHDIASFEVPVCVSAYRLLVNGFRRNLFFYLISDQMANILLYDMMCFVVDVVVEKMMMYSYLSERVEHITVSGKMAKVIDIKKNLV